MQSFTVYIYISSIMQIYHMKHYVELQDSRHNGLEIGGRYGGDRIVTQFGGVYISRWYC